MLPRDLGNGSRTAESRPSRRRSRRELRRDPGGALGGGGRGQARGATAHCACQAVARAIDLPMPSPTFGQQRWKRSDESATAILQSARHAADLISGDLRVATTEVDSPADEALTDLSRTARLIVLGSDEVSLGTAILVGSTTTAVATHSICPVVAWRGDAITPTKQPIVLGIGHDHDRRVAITADSSSLIDSGVGVIAVHAWSTRRPAGDVTLPFMIDWNQVENDERHAFRTGWRRGSNSTLTLR